MAKFKFGDAVWVRDAGSRYSTYRGFFEKNHVPNDMAIRYAYNAYVQPGSLDGLRFRVLFVGNHERGGTLYLICREDEWRYGEVYLFGEYGLESAELRVFKVPVRASFYIDVEATDSYDAEEKAVRIIGDAVDEGGIDGWVDYLGVDGDVEEVED